MSNDSNVFVSVIIPVHNKELYIRRSINSVLNQEYENFELIIIEDASTDNSLSVIQKFNDSRIRLFHRNKPGAGGYAARNFGIKKAKSSWIAFLDADDEWDKNHLKIAHEAINEYSGKYGICTGRYIVKKGKKSIDKWTMTSNVDEEILDFNKVIREVPSRKYPWSTNSMILPKDKFMNSGMFPTENIKRGGDGIAWIKYLLDNNEIIRINIPTTIYYKYGIANQITSRSDNITLPHPNHNIISHLIESENRLQKYYLKRYLNNSTINRIKKKVENNQFIIKDLEYLYPFSFTIRMAFSLFKAFLINFKKRYKSEI